MINKMNDSSTRKPKRHVHSADQRVTQTLSSGIIVRQDFRTSTRFPFFYTGHEEWPYATNGGTLLVVQYRARPYVLTCRHIAQTYRWNELIVTSERFGGKAADLAHVAYASSPVLHAVDTDVLDVAVIEFSQDVTCDFFADAPYLIDERTITSSNGGDQLLVNGALKTPSVITETEIAPKFCLLEMVDNTDLSHDPTLRRCFGVFDKPEFDDVVGLSGSPVFNLTQAALCGIVVRGAMVGDVCTLRYVDMFDVCRLLEGVNSRSSSTFYTKKIRMPTR
jgi:hypothetical protein